MAAGYESLDSGSSRFSLTVPYVGAGEARGAAVVCHDCRGQGSYAVEHRFAPPAQRKPPPEEVTHVWARNPWVGLSPEHCVGADGKPDGGVPVAEFDRDPEAPFARGREMRTHVCPAWWGTGLKGAELPASLEKKCSVGLPLNGRFSRCDHFADKDGCWKEYDRDAEAGATK